MFQFGTGTFHIVERTADPAAGSKLLDKTFQLLRLFAAAERPVSLAELAKAAQLPKPTVHRLLKSMCRHDMLSKSAGDYRLGPLALVLGRQAQAQIELRRVALPILYELAEESGETVLLFELAPARDRVTCVEQIESRRGIRLVSGIGTQLPLHAGASSRVILAHLEADIVARVLAGPLPRVARGTITRPDALRRQLGRIRKEGYATSFEESSDGAAGVAVPIFDRHGEVIASVSIAGPITRLTEARVAALARIARRGAAAVHRAIGGMPPAPAGANKASVHNLATRATAAASEMKAIGG